MKKMLLVAAIGVILLLSGIQAVALKPDVTTSKTFNNGNRDFTHNVFAEDCTATWCPHCPYAHQALNNLFWGGWHPFYYCSLVDDKNANVASRETEYNLY